MAKLRHPEQLAEKLARSLCGTIETGTKVMAWTWKWIDGELWVYRHHRSVSLALLRKKPIPKSCVFFIAIPEENHIRIITSDVSGRDKTIKTELNDHTARHIYKKRKFFRIEYDAEDWPVLMWHNAKLQKKMERLRQELDEAGLEGKERQRRFEQRLQERLTDKEKEILFLDDGVNRRERHDM